MRVLVVEDSLRIRNAVEAGLRRRGFAVDAVGDGRQGLIHARTTEYDVIVLDVMLPEIDGFEVLRRLRDHRVMSSILLLTARSSVHDRVHGLRAGADDYLIKPFAFDELVARIESLIRRRHGAKDPVLRIDDLEVDVGRRVVRRAGTTIELKPREYAIIEYLAHRAGTTVSRSELEEHIYDDRTSLQSNSIDSAICTLRAKLGVGSGRRLIHTRRGAGYMLAEEDA